MITMNYQLGAAADPNAKTVGADGETRTPGERLDRYPWERAIKAKQVYDAMQASDRAAPIPMGPALLGRGRAQKAAILMALAKHGSESPRDVAYASVRDMIAWARAGRPDVDMRRVVQDRLARARSMSGTTIPVNAPSAVDFVRAKARGVVAAGLQIFRGQGGR